MRGKSRNKYRTSRVLYIHDSKHPYLFINTNMSVNTKLAWVGAGYIWKKKRQASRVNHEKSQSQQEAVDVYIQQQPKTVVLTISYPEYKHSEQ